MTLQGLIAIFLTFSSLLQPSFSALKQYRPPLLIKNKYNIVSIDQNLNQLKIVQPPNISNLLFIFFEYLTRMIEEDRKTKQQYLREEILDRNYDAQEFIGFLNKQLKIDSDLNLCSMDELKDVVKLFIEQKQNTIVERVGEIEQSLVIKRQMQKSTIVYKDYDPPVAEEEYEKDFKCLKIVPKFSQDILGKMICEVSKPERKYVEVIFGIGTSSYLQFQVTTSGVDWCVGRRYSDFIWFRNTLKRFFPSQVIPPIPNKKAAKRSVSQIEKRMRILSYFLNDLIKIPEIVHSKYFQGFLSLKDASKFQKFKKETDDKEVFQSIASSETQTGIVTVTLSNENTAFFNALKKFSNKSEVLYKEVTRASKRFQAQRIDEVNQLYELGNLFSELYESGKQFYMATKNDNILNLSEIYIKLNNMMIEWGNNIKNEIDLLEVNFNTFFKYARESYMGFNEYFQKLDGLQKEFLLRRSELNQKKQRIFLLHDPNKWDIPKKDIPYLPKSSVHERTQAFKIMLPKESVEVENLKTNYSFYLSRLFQNGNKYFQKQMVKFNENFNQFSIRHKVNNQQLCENWNEMCYIFSVGNKAAKKLLMMQKLKHVKDLTNSQIIQD